MRRLWLLGVLIIWVSFLFLFFFFREFCFFGFAVEVGLMLIYYL